MLTIRAADQVFLSLPSFLRQPYKVCYHVGYNDYLQNLTQFLEIEVPEINSVTTDTCTIMRSFWKELRSYPPFKRSIMILCDSHGLQLLIKDIIETIDPYKITSERFNAIVAFFNKAYK
jgi:hypothetical protein